MLKDFLFNHPARAGAQPGVSAQTRRAIAGSGSVALGYAAHQQIGGWIGAAIGWPFMALGAALLLSSTREKLPSPAEVRGKIIDLASYRRRSKVGG